jgi:hypothetical protein
MRVVNHSFWKNEREKSGHPAGAAVMGLKALMK